MADFRRLTPDFAVAPQISPHDVARAATDGFKTIVCNRNENEEPGQPSNAEIIAAAELAGLAFRALPFTGMPPPAIVAETVLIMEQRRGPILAFCRSGRRSATAWAMAQALSGSSTPHQIIEAAAKAGFDLTPAREALEYLAPRR